jgi:hypothetical protein
MDVRDWCAGPKQLEEVNSKLAGLVAYVHLDKEIL